jgi:signal transduction histidine kinase
MSGAQAPLIWRRWFGSTTLRIAALVFILQLLAAGSVLLYARYATSSQFTRDQQVIVSELENDFRAWHHSGGDRALADEIDGRLNSLKGESIVVLLVDAQGKRIAGNLRSWPTVVPWETPWRSIELYRIGGASAERLGIRATTLPGGSHLLTGRVIESDLRLRETSERAMLAAFLLALPLALMVAAIVSRLIDRRVSSIADTATAVGDGDLSRRAFINGSGDSFDLLSGKVNAMLARIEVLVGELRIITSGLAHDLRTPILRLTATLEQAATEVRDPAAIKAIYKVSTEADNLMSMLSTALQISQAEAGIGRNRFVEVDIAELLADIAELYEPALETQDMVCHVHALPIRFRLHRELVSQAICNLVDNAMKYAEGASQIDLTARLTDTHVEITVADDGPGIALEDRAAALRRFGRLDPSRHTSGAGLGLSLVEAVARLHDGTIAFEDNKPGLRVTLTLAL